MNEIIVELYGASGGIGGSHGGKYASMGGYVKTKLKVTQGGEYYVYVGGKPVGGKHIGGFNGGGNSGDTSSGDYNAAGGGASHISSFNAQLRDLEDKKESILAVAGGGGGWGKQTTENVHTILLTPGNGGGPNGLNATTNGNIFESKHGDTFFEKSALGGTQTNGGSGGIGCTLSSGSGSFGKGGDGIKHDQRGVPHHVASGCKKAASDRAMSVEHSAGGGAGYYGGGAGGLSMSGAGGSSYVNPLYKSDDFETIYKSNISYPTHNSEGQHGFIKITDKNGTVTEFNYNGSVQIYTAPNIVQEVIVPVPIDTGRVITSPGFRPIHYDDPTLSILPIRPIRPISDITDDNIVPITEPRTPIPIIQEEESHVHITQLAEESITSYAPIIQEEESNASHAPSTQEEESIVSHTHISQLEEESIAQLAEESIASYTPIAQLAEESIASYTPITQLAEESIASYTPIAQLTEESIASYTPIAQLTEESIASYTPIAQLAEESISSYTHNKQLEEEMITSNVSLRQLEEELTKNQNTSYKQLAEESLSPYKLVNNKTEKQNTYNIIGNNVMPSPPNKPVNNETEKQNTHVIDNKAKTRKITKVPDIAAESNLSNKTGASNLEKKADSSEKTKSIDEVDNNKTSEKKIVSKKGTNWLFYFFVLLILILILFAFSLFATKKAKK
jgi:hypothetical protein